MKLNSQQGGMLQTTEEIEQELTHYYKDLLTEPSVNIAPAINQVLQHIPSIISQEQNFSLTQDISPTEVEEAVMVMNPRKSLGLDGFTTDFF